MDTLAAYATKRFHKDVMDSELHQKHAFLSTKIDIIGTVHTSPSHQSNQPSLVCPTLVPSKKGGQA